MSIDPRLNKKNFQTIDTQYSKYNGQSWKIIRQLGLDDVDESVGNMYEIELECGDIIHAFEDEIYEI